MAMLLCLRQLQPLPLLSLFLALSALSVFCLVSRALVSTPPPSLAPRTGPRKNRIVFFCKKSDDNNSSSRCLGQPVFSAASVKRKLHPPSRRAAQYVADQHIANEEGPPSWSTLHTDNTHPLGFLNPFRHSGWHVPVVRYCALTKAWGRVHQANCLKVARLILSKRIQVKFRPRRASEVSLTQKRL